MLNMVAVTRFDLESTGVWSFPFTFLVLLLIVAAADVLFSFIPFEIGSGGWLWAISTTATAVIASYVAERLSTDRRKALISMTLAATFSVLFYRDLSALVQRTPVQAISGATSNPFIGMAFYTAAITVVPSAFVGVILGGVISSFKVSKKKFKPEFVFPAQAAEKVEMIGHELACVSCGRSLPFDSKFCPFCGREPEHRSLPAPKFCRFCGAHLRYRGMFCPECGDEIEMISKPHIFYSY
jgi:RNA polymerase subunit RPABC4/transcription elongation factor Spt4